MLEDPASFSGHDLLGHQSMSPDKAPIPVYLVCNEDAPNPYSMVSISEDHWQRQEEKQAHLASPLTKHMVIPSAPQGFQSAVYRAVWGQLYQH